MSMFKKRWILGTTLVFCCCTAFLLAYGEDQTKVKGLITGRTADSLTLRTSDGTNMTALLTDDTKVQMPKGLGLRKKQVAWTELIPGLRVEIKGTTNPKGQLEAHEVNFNKEDLHTASMIQAGLQPTQQQVQANQQAIASNQAAIATTTKRIDANEEAVDKRFSDLADYDVKKKLVVKFRTGSSEIAEADKDNLCNLAKSSDQTPGSLIEVKGFADSSGNAQLNQTLSRDRAESVVNTLMQDCSVQPRRILAPGAMGISNPVASNETDEGKADNRRAEVTVLVNKGVVAGNQ